ncbi:MAG: hypothetical protein H8D60_02575 [Cryomorphaceae bacterium]|nr:hypothetical protein [Cryomorphaceae bacterium]
MKKLMYLIIAALMLTFTACGGGETTTEETVVEETVEVTTKGVGCQIGEPCVTDHSCCNTHNESTEAEKIEEEGG